MDEAIEAIRTALVADATEKQRLTGVGACRAILSVLDPKPVEPPPTAPAAAAPPASPPTFESPPVAQIVAAVRGLPPEQLLDLAIARLRAALPAGTAVPNAQPLKLQLIPLHPAVATRPKK